VITGTGTLIGVRMLSAFMALVAVRFRVDTLAGVAAAILVAGFVEAAVGVDVAAAV
jgi:hypothetical protein